MRTRFTMWLAALTFLAACHPGQVSPPTRPEPTGPRDQYLILGSELESTSRDNLYDAVRQLRPGWFTRQNRQQSGEDNIIVYLDDRQLGPATALRRFSVRSIHSVKYLSPTEAQVRYGQTNIGRPAILVEMARQ